MVLKRSEMRMKQKTILPIIRIKITMIQI